jgi:hypothetical protein
MFGNIAGNYFPKVLSVSTVVVLLLISLSDPKWGLFKKAVVREIEKSPNAQITGVL